MIAGLHPLVQSLLGTFLTWGLTAAGAGLVFIWSGGKVGGEGSSEELGPVDRCYYVLLPRWTAVLIHTCSVAHWTVPEQT